MSRAKRCCGLLLASLLGLHAAFHAAFAKPRGFATAERPKALDGAEQDVAGSEALASSLERGLDVVIAGGSLPGLWLAMLLSAGLTTGHVARVRLYQGRPSRRAQDVEVVTINGVVWNQIPEDVKQLLSSEVGLVEQWPKQLKESGRSEKDEDFPRNASARRLREALQRSLEVKGVEVLSEDYSLTEHRQLEQQGGVQCIAFTDGDSLKACEEIFEELFSQPVPRSSADGFLVTPERSLAVSFELKEPLAMGSTMALNWAQRRYFVNSTGELDGVLQVRLTPGEGQMAADSLQGADPLRRLRESHESDRGLQELWQDISEACELYGFSSKQLVALEVFTESTFERPRCTGLPQVELGTGPLVAFLLGGAAHGGSARFGPGCGASLDLEAATSAAKALLAETKQRLDLDKVASHELVMKGLCSREREVGLGLGECIASGQRMDGVQAEEAMLMRLEATLKQMRSHPDRWPRGVLDSLPRRLAPTAAPRTWRAMAAAGPWPDAAAEEAQRTVAEASAAAYDFGGETAEGLQAASRLKQQGSAEAMLHLGVMYVTANGLNKDMVKGFHWIQKAAELGHLEAQNCLGTMLRNGLGVEIQKEEAARWFEKAGAKGHAEAQFNLGEMLWDAELPQDLEAGVLLFQKAAQADLHAAQYKLGLALRRGLGVDMDVARGMEYIDKAAQQGLAQAQYFLGTCHFSGDGVLRDPIKAAGYFRKAAEQGDAMSQYSLGVLHELGEGVPQSDAQAQHWFRAAAAQGSLEAQARVRGPGLLPPGSS